MSSGNDLCYLGLTEILEEEDFPYIYHKSFEDMAREDYYEKMVAYTKLLLKQDIIDSTITRSSNVAKLLEQEGIEHTKIYPSLDTMIKQLNLLIQDIKLIQLQEKQLAVGEIQIKKGQQATNAEIDDITFKQISLNKALLEFNQQQKHSLIFNENQIGFEVLTTIKALRKLTNNFTICELSAYLKKELPYNVKVSWGVSSEPEKARRLALDGMEIINKSTSEESSILNYFENWVVLKNDTAMSNVPDILNNKIYQISDYLEVSPDKIKQIMAIQQRELTAKIVAEELNITTRSANRFLNKLVKKKRGHPNE